jgi:hypothetical protein
MLKIGRGDSSGEAYRYLVGRFQTGKFPFVLFLLGRHDRLCGKV